MTAGKRMSCMAYQTIRNLETLSDQELVDYFSLCGVRLTKAANKLQHLSENKWGREKDRVQAELLRRMAERDTELT